MPTSVAEARARMAQAAGAQKVPVNVSVSVPLTDAKGAERHSTKASPSQFAKAQGSGVALIKSVISKSSVVKVGLSITDENGDKANSAPEALTANVWTETYAK